MFKKIASIAIAAMLIGSTAAIAATAAENEEAVAAADDSVVAAADDSSVGAEEGSETTSAGTKVYFKVPSDWKNFKKITFFLNDHTTGTQLITWGSKKGFMTDEGDGKWSFDLGSAGFDLGSGGPYNCIFTADWGVQTCDLIITTDNYGDTAYCPGGTVENAVDSNKSSFIVKWESGKNGNPICITSIGNLIGDAYWPGENNESVFYKFISTTDASSIKNATKFNGKNEQQTIDDIAGKLGLSKSQVEAQVKKATDAGAKLDWDASKSTLSDSGSQGGGNQGGNQGGNNQDGGNTTGNTTGGSTGGGTTYGGSSGGTSTGSVTSGEDTTVYFIIGGVMIAAIGVFFLARKRRQY